MKPGNRENSGCVGRDRREPAGARPASGGNAHEGLRASEPARPRQPRPQSRAFTLIEVVGVLAILAILVSIAAATVIRRVDQAYVTREIADLNTIADAYLLSAARNRVIPGAGQWADAVGKELSMPVSRVTTTPRGFARAFLVDPSLRLGPGAGSGVLPFIQSSAGSINPASARVMLVSSLARSALPVTTGVPTIAEFDAIWDTPEGSVPSTWGAWGSGDDLRIKRLNLGSLFHQLVLIDHDRDLPAIFSISGSTTNAVPVGGFGLGAYYLDGTIVGLHDPVGTVQSRYLLKRSISFIFELGFWHGEIPDSRKANEGADTIADEVRLFLNSDLNPDTNKGADQLGVTAAMLNYMQTYTRWANYCPHFDDRNVSSMPSLPEFQMLDAVGKKNPSGIMYDTSLWLLSER